MTKEGRMSELNVSNARFEVMKSQVVVLWVMTPCSSVVGYHLFRLSY